MVALSILVGSLVIAFAIHRHAKAMESNSEDLDHALRMLWGVFAMQLRVELDEAGYEVPEWLIFDDPDDEEEERHAQIINIKLLKRPGPEEES